MEWDNRKVFELLQAIGSGNERSMRELYQQYSRKVYAFALNQLRNPHEAEEIVVDTLHEVWKNPARFRGDSKFSTWLLGIARHKILDAFRARRPQADELDYDEMGEVLESDDPTPFDVFAHGERREGVRRCLERLPEEQRECMHLVFYEGLSLGEIAALQGCPENTVKTRLFHARQKIRGCLQRLLEREAGNV
jgi:RNA polymerase sigma-70 factor (ECF subfamily)